MSVPEKSEPGGLDRFLRLFSDVRAGEGPIALLLALDVFLILTAYYILKPVREALILGQGTAELKSYVSAGQVAVLALAVPLYGRLAARMSRRRLINRVTAFFVLCLIAFYVLARFDVPLGVPYYLWLGVFNLMIIAQFWSFANDVYVADEGERLFPIVAFGASAGAVLGAVVAGQLIEPLGVYQLMLLAAGILVVATMITNYVDEREGGVPATARTASRDAGGETDADPPGGTAEHGSTARGDEEVGEAGADTAGSDPSDVGVGRSASFKLVFGSRYLLFIALILLLLNWVNTTGEYILGSVVEDVAEQAVAAGTAGGLTVEQYIGDFYSGFYGVVNVAGLVIQLFLVSRIIKYLGGKAILVLPCIAMVAYGLLAFFPVLGAVRWAKTAENSTDYSLNNTVRNMLFLPTSRAAKYSAKQAIDSFFVRAGDVLSAGVVFVGTTFLAFSPGEFAGFNLVLVGVWLVLGIAVARMYRRRVGNRGLEDEAPTRVAA